LAQGFAEAGAARQDRPVPAFAPEVMERLRRYSWPGNVRELRNVVDAAMALTDSNVIGLRALPPELLDDASTELDESSASRAMGLPGAMASSANLKDTERATILAQIEACGGNLTEAARRLGIARSTLYLRLKGYGSGRPAR